MTARKAWAAVAAKTAGTGQNRAVARSKAVPRPAASKTPVARPARSKYGAVRTGKYASKREAARAVELRLLEKAGKIFDLREQVAYELVPKQEGERALTYVCDFLYEEPSDDPRSWGNREGWAVVAEDCKGYRTPEYRIKRKLMLYLKGIRLRET